MDLHFPNVPGSQLVDLLERTAPPAWGARVQEFKAGGIGVTAVIILQPDVPGLDQSWTPATEAFPPLFVIVPDTGAYQVAPALHELFGSLGMPASSSRRAETDIEGEWQVLDGPEPLVKLRLRAGGAIPLDADLVLYAEDVAPYLYLAAGGGPVGVMPAERVPLLPNRGILEDALLQLLLVPTSPSRAFDDLLRRHRWTCYDGG